MISSRLMERYLLWSVAQQHQRICLGLHQRQRSRPVVVMVNPDHQQALASRQPI